MSNYETWASTPIDRRPEYSVVIPAYNEEMRIIPTVGAIAAELSEFGHPWELIVSDDGSTDQTVPLLEELDLANLHVVTSPNTGKGGAVRRGIHAARGKYVLFADADQSTPIEQFARLLAAIELDGADIAIGSRATEGAEVQNKSFMRKVFSAGLRAVVKIGFRLPVDDTQCGFKLFTAEAADDLFGRQRIDGFSFDFEILWLAHRDGMTITEVPVEWIDAPGSTVDPLRNAVDFLGDLVRIRIWALRGFYGRKAAAGPQTPQPLHTQTQQETKA